MKFIGLILILAVSSVHCSFWQACPGGIRAPTTVTSPVCSGNTCTVTRGQRSEFTASIKFGRAHTRLMTRLLVKRGPFAIVIPQPLEYANACNFMRPSCPTVPNTPHSLTYPIVVPADATVTPSTLARFELLENGVIEACVVINISVV